MYIVLMDRIRGIDRETWPETRATVTNIEQPYTSRSEFLSRITFSFRDSTGDYYSGKLDMPTADLPEDLTEGAEITIHYFPKDPNQSWSKDDYWRARQPEAAALQLMLLGVFLMVIIIFVVSWMRSLLR